MTISYKFPAGSAWLEVDRPLAITPQGGKIALDETLVRLAKAADDHSLEEVLDSFKVEGADPTTIRAGLACLAEAGILQRSPAAGPAIQLTKEKGALISVVIVTYNGLEWLPDLMPSLEAQSYGPLEIIIVDNASRDGTPAFVAKNYAQARLLALDEPHPLAYAINRGVALARGDYFLLLNQDLHLEPGAVAELVQVAINHPGCGAVGAKLKFIWAPAFLNGLGNRVDSTSWGSDIALGHLDLGQFDTWEQVPSVCFAATLVSRRAWEAVGTVDEGFPLYYEDVEWAYRARSLGYPVYLAPAAVVYHAFGGRVPSGQVESLTPRKLRNVVYGRYRFAFKLLNGTIRNRFVINYIGEDWANFLKALLLRRGKDVFAFLQAWLAVVRDSPGILRHNRLLRLKGIGPPQLLFSGQAKLPRAQEWRGLPFLTWDLVLYQYLPLIRQGVTKPMPEFIQADRRKQFLIISNDIVDVKMAGPGMRYLEMARALSHSAQTDPGIDVTLAVPASTKLEIPGIHLVQYQEDHPRSIEVLVSNADCALISQDMVEKFPFLAHTRTRLVVDLYDPFILENLHYYQDQAWEVRVTANRHAVQLVNRLVQIGDFFICGNERQRDFWLGALATGGRVNPTTFSQDPGLRQLIEVVGVGIPDRPLEKQTSVLSNYPAIPAEARIVLWGGGIWNWLDPLTLIKAWPQVIARHPEARLVFLGTRHPNPKVPLHAMAEQAQALAAEIGEKDRSIIFIEWLSYAERESLLSEAAIGVTLHPVHVETRYSIRTRVLDYIWARLPVLVTAGDITSEWVDLFGIGQVVPPYDEDAVARGLIDILDQPREHWQKGFDTIQPLFRWKNVVVPLRRYILTGEHAADWQESQAEASPNEMSIPASRWEKMRTFYRQGGLRGLLARILYHFEYLLTPKKPAGE